MHMAHTIVIFGASGDLTSRKLIPALYELYRKKRLPENTRIVGFSRTQVQPRGLAGEAGRDDGRSSWARTSTPRCGSSSPRRSSIMPGDIGNGRRFPVARPSFWRNWKATPAATRIYYLATAPQFYEPAIAQLGAAGLADEDRGPRRVVIEKPFGTDLATARQLNETGPRGLRRAPGLSHRPLPGQGDRAERDGAAVRQQHLRADLEPQLHRPRADHRGRGSDRRPPRGVLRLGRRAARHVPEPPAATDDADGDGGPRPLRGRRHPRREGEGAAGGPRHEARGGVHRHDPRPVPQVPRRAGRAARQRNGHLRRRQAAHRQLALAGRALPAPQRQGHVVPDHADRDPVPPAAAHDVRGRAAGGRSSRTGW